ncbi:signal peptidase I [Dongshaea marina]|uniref:signal peptidase I n=1 Tax=Dongshaea marina TaxID=2047966 RepID=UPI000D3EDCA2|nr:signal peptidase I [Dongshaea marina]
MANLFSLILTLVTVLTGIIWIVDKLVFKRRRQVLIDEAQQQSEEPLSKEQLAQVAPVPGWLENGRSIFPVILVVLILRSFIFEPFQIPSGSMMPTLLPGDFILVQKFAYGLRDPVFHHKFLETGEPKRGDVAVFRYPPNPKIDYIKRIVGLPGDTIIYQNKTLYVKPACHGAKTCPGLQQVTKNYIGPSQFSQMGMPLERYQEQLGKVTHDILRNPMLPEQYPSYYRQPGQEVGEWVVPPGHYFAMGDNRDNSADSRYWGFVAEKNLVGKAVAIWISFTFDHSADSWLPSWVPTGVRFSRIGGIT